MKKLAALVAVASALSAPAFADTNVALGGNVTVAGAGFGNWSSMWGSGSLASLATVTDGVFLPIQQQWNTGTVFWNGAYNGDASNFVTIALNARSTVTRFTLQADNNDDYGIQYRDVSNTWTNLVTISPHRSWGMDLGSATLATPVTTDAFRIRSVGGDGYYSVSEFQAFGNVAAVPEPETYSMLAAGLGLLGLIGRRKKKAAA